MRSADTARAWTENLVAEILRPLQSATEDRLFAIPWIERFPVSDLAAATLMIRLAAWYAGGERPDDLIARLQEAVDGSERPMSAQDARSLVLVARLMVHTSRLPDPRWWEPLYHAQHLAIACVREAVAAGQNPAEVLGRLGFPAAVEKEISEVAEHDPGICFGASGKAPEGRDDLLFENFQGEIAEAAISAVREAFPEAAEDRPDLLLGVAYASRLRVALEQARDDGDDGVVEFIDRQVERFAEACAGLSMLELELMRQVEDDELLLMRVANVAKTVITVSGEMEPTGLTDLIDGRRELPRELELYFGLSGQSYQQRVGPIISWSVTFERVLPDGFERGRPMQVGVGFSEEVDTEFTVQTTYDGEEMDASLYYPPGAATATLALAILALTRNVRLDFFIQTSSRSIRHVSQGAVLLPDELHAKTVERAVVRCRELMVDGSQGVIQVLQQEHSGEEAPVIAFLMNEHGKSEQLLDARSPGAALGSYRQATPEQEAKLAQARRRLLTAEAERIEHPSDDRRKSAIVEASAYIGLIQRARGPDPRDRARRSIEDVGQELGGIAPDRAVVHLTIDYRGLELAWADRVDGEVNVELLPCQDIDLDELAAALGSPEEGSVVALDRPDGSGVALGRRLRDQMLNRGVAQLLICSTRNLHQLPVHALRISTEGDERLLDVADVIYAPSAAIAAALADLAPRVGPRVVVGAAGLRYAAAEATLVARVVDAEEVLIGDVATPETVLAGLDRASWVHIASHGGYLPVDYLASGLLLPTAENSRAHLNVARILSEADLSGIDLAVLGACQTGAGQTAPSTLDVAGGIDTAFLAAGVRNVVSALWGINDLGALLFHGELFRNLYSGRTLNESYRMAIDLLRSGSWQHVDDLPLGTLLADVGVDMEEAMLVDQTTDQDIVPVDFGELKHWASYRICGLGSLGG